MTPSHMTPGRATPAHTSGDDSVWNPNAQTPARPTDSENFPVSLIFFFFLLSLKRRAGWRSTAQRVDTAARAQTLQDGHRRAAIISRLLLAPIIRQVRMSFWWLQVCFSCAVCDSGRTRNSGSAHAYAAFGRPVFGRSVRRIFVCAGWIRFCSAFRRFSQRRVAVNAAAHHAATESGSQSHVGFVSFVVVLFHFFSLL